MTILGICVCSPDRALAWADTQTFVNGMAAGRVPKLTINATARIIGAGAGWDSLMERADAAVIRAMSLEEVVEGLPAMLRHASASLASSRRDPESFTSNVFALVGFSMRWCRMVGYVFDAQQYFEPRRVSNFCTPVSHELAAMCPGSIDDISGIAVQQLADLSRSYDRPVGGPVTAAILTPQSVSARILQE
jgi:hypothetical protein